MRCFYLKEIPDTGESVDLDKREKQHLFKILRAKSGDQIELIDGAGRVAGAIVGPDRIIRVNERQDVPPPKTRFHLYVAPPKKQKMDILLKQATEMGVWSINPIISEYSVAIPRQNSVNERWQQQLVEACKQSKNRFLPQLNPAADFKSAVEDVCQNGFLPIFGGVSSPQELPAADKTVADVAWFVGPEGGFSEEELALMRQQGFAELHIGRCILRTETAAVAGLAVLTHHFMWQ